MVNYKVRNNNIISFSGRKESGKTELANICVEYGYEKKSFATALKNLVCNLVGFNTIEELNNYKNVPIRKEMSNEMILLLSKETGIEYDYIKSVAQRITKESTGRDWLQVVGTDIIREKDPDWHVKKTLSTFEEGKKYVIDDTRFPNELNALKEMDAECWFIIRNKTDNISNHPSETSLTYLDFDYNVIVNNITLDTFRKRWKCFLEYHDTTMVMREWLISLLFMNDHIPMSEHTAHKLYVYKEFTQLKGMRHKDFPYAQPLNIREKITHDGFIGDDDNPFITETWKMYY